MNQDNFKTGFEKIAGSITKSIGRYWRTITPKSQKSVQSLKQTMKAPPKQVKPSTTPKSNAIENSEQQLFGQKNTRGISGHKLYNDPKFWD